MNKTTQHPIMKKTLQLIPILLLATAITACTADYDEPEQPTTRQDEVPVDSIGVTSPDNPEKDYTVISTVPVSDDVKAFFDKALPNSDTDPAFAFPSGSDNIFYVINGQQDLVDRYIGDGTPPKIDFDKYTLIIGRANMPGLTYHVESLEIHKYEDAQTLCVFTDNPSSLFWMTYNMHFWGLFPHNDMTISNLNVITKEKD